MSKRIFIDLTLDDNDQIKRLRTDVDGKVNSLVREGALPPLKLPVTPDFDEYSHSSEELNSEHENSDSEDELVQRNDLLPAHLLEEHKFYNKRSNFLLTCGLKTKECELRYNTKCFMCFPDMKNRYELCPICLYFTLNLSTTI